MNMYSGAIEQFPSVRDCSCMLYSCVDNVCKYSRSYSSLASFGFYNAIRVCSATLQLWGSLWILLVANGALLASISSAPFLGCHTVDVDIQCAADYFLNSKFDEERISTKEKYCYESVYRHVTPYMHKFFFTVEPLRQTLFWFIMTGHWIGL